MKTHENHETVQVRFSEFTSQKVIQSYLKPLAICFSIYVFLWLFWHEYMLVDFETIFASPVSLGEALYSVRFLLPWPIVLACIATVVNKLVRSLGIESTKSLEFDCGAGELFRKGMFLSLNAGVFEELIYRWLTFSSAMVIVVFFNWITFGLYKWVMMTILVPVANWATLGYLEPQLMGTEWTIAAAIIMANGDFRSAHNLGLLNKINAWFIGMLFFYMVFHYGILSAIVAHVLYDCFVFTIVAIHQSMDKSTASTT